MSLNLMIRINRIAGVALPLIIIVVGLASCAGIPPSTIPSATLAVNPSSTIVAAGSVTSFSAVFTPSEPVGGSVTWSVTPATGGTITNEGVYTASATPGNYVVVATWTPVSPLRAAIFSGTATVEVLPVPQTSAEVNPDLVQASGAQQTGGAIQNGAIAGQSIDSVVSTDPSGNVQVRSSFTPPSACTATTTPSCP